MAEAPTIQWTGQSGKTYKYWIHPLGTSLKAVAGNYIFATETDPNRWRPIYIGQTGDLMRGSTITISRIARRGMAQRISIHTPVPAGSRLGLMRRQTWFGSGIRFVMADPPLAKRGRRFDQVPMSGPHNRSKVVANFFDVAVTPFLK